MALADRVDHAPVVVAAVVALAALVPVDLAVWAAPRQWVDATTQSPRVVVAAAIAVATKTKTEIETATTATGSPPVGHGAAPRPDNPAAR